MKLTRLILPCAGLLLLGVVLSQADHAALWIELRTVGSITVLAVLSIHAVSFLWDVILWLLAFRTVPGSLGTWCEFYLVRLVGEAYNNALPLASVGGEPVKAKLLKDYLAIDYAASGAAFLIAKTANLIALVAFLAIGFVWLLSDARFSTAYRLVAALGLGAFATASVLLVLLQQGRVAPLLSRLFPHIARTPRWSRMLEGLTRLEERLLAVYRRDPRRLGGILGLAFLTWLAGVFEIQVILHAAGTPVTFAEAWIVEAAAQLVRAAVFFIPAGLGAVDGSLVVVVSLITGSTTLGFMVAVVRRVRDLIWIALGFLAGLRFVARPSAPSDRDTA